MRLSKQGSIAFVLSSALLLCLGLPLAMVSSASAQSDSLFRDFAPDHKFQLLVDGSIDDTAQVYRSQRAASFLVISRSLSTPFLVVPRSQQVQGVDLMKISARANGTVDLLADAVMASLGSFSIREGDIGFKIDGRDVTLREKPDLTGDQTPETMRAYSSSYADLEKAYTPSADAMKKLNGASGITVTVYFGSWCPFCSQYVPGMMKVASELGSSGVEIEFYGLAKQFASDARATRDNINGVPTGVVRRDGKEIGRLINDAWRSPEAALVKIIEK
jgi:thiol-disulfide isomerase/thioredoxin